MSIQATTIKITEAQTQLEEMETILHDFLNPEHDAGQMRKREQILTAATSLFVAHGYRKTSMDEVAHKAGVAKGTLYLYYRNKAELLMHAIALHNQQHTDDLALVFDAGLSPREQLHKLIVIGLTLSKKAPLLAKLTGDDHEILLALRDISDDTLHKINELKIEFTGRLIDAATDVKKPPEEIRQRTIILIDLMFAVISSDRWVKSEQSLEEYAIQLADVIIGGIIA